MDVLLHPLSSNVSICLLFSSSQVLTFFPCFHEKQVAWVLAEPLFVRGRSNVHV